MTWNYRVGKRTINGEEIYNIYEVYYDEQDNIQGITQEPAYPQGETVEELKDDIAAYIKALDKPVVDYDSVDGLFERVVEAVMNERMEAWDRLAEL